MVRFWTKVVPVRASCRLFRKEDEKLIFLGAWKAKALLAYYVGLESWGSIPNVCNRDSHRYLHQWRILRENFERGNPSQ